MWLRWTGNEGNVCKGCGWRGNLYLRCDVLILRDMTLIGKTHFRCKSLHEHLPQNKNSSDPEDNSLYHRATLKLKVNSTKSSNFRLHRWVWFQDDQWAHLREAPPQTQCFTAVVYQHYQGSRLRLKRSHLRPKILICEWSFGWGRHWRLYIFTCYDIKICM